MITDLQLGDKSGRLDNVEYLYNDQVYKYKPRKPLYKKYKVFTEEDNEQLHKNIVKLQRDGLNNSRAL